jgi:CheY-like chemotaxis protein
MASSQNPCVLIVEDEPDTLEAVVELLEGEGVTTQQARHGLEALELLRSGCRPSLILLDLKMPVMDGPEFLQKLALERDLRDIPVAVVSASASLTGLPARVNDAGLFTKPVNFLRLLTLVRRFCG